MGSEAVKVIVRCRPMNEREEKLNCGILVEPASVRDGGWLHVQERASFCPRWRLAPRAGVFDIHDIVVINMDTAIGQVQLRKPKVKEAPPKLFTFDGVFFTHDTTEQIYEDICFPLVEGVLDGYNGTVFAYGQTGCGKSYTMMGVEDPVENRGVIPRAFNHIFDHVASSVEVKFLMKASYLEIYNEEVRDLLGRDVKKKLDLHEHPDRGVYVQDLSSHKVHNAHDLSRVMELGSKNRSVGATLMNVDSSRSHSIFTIDIEMVKEGGEGGIRAGRLNLVDLAGSERQSKTGSTGDRLKEATKINLSLSALGNVISALVDGRSTHIPYRDSKLTRLLQSSLGGNTKTLMVACVSPADNNYDETLSTLRYANRAKNIKNKPRINEDPKDALLRQYKEEIEKLKAQLLGGGVPMPVQGPSSTEDRHADWEAEREAIRREYESKMVELRQQYDQVHADKTQLQDQLSDLERQKQQELDSLQNRLNQSASKSGQAPPTTTPSGSLGVPHTIQSGPPVTAGSDERQLVEHEAALQRLEELQQTMIGGERAGDGALRQELAERKQRAEEKRVLIIRANQSLEDEDGIIEGIFNSLTDEVRAKSRALERSQVKLQSAQEDIVDLQTEFELERQDYLNTIRNQERMLRLHEQLLATASGLVRRDCNYYNIDKIKTECTWNQDTAEWSLPRVTVTKTTLSPVSSHTSMQRKSSSTSTLPSCSSSFSLSPRMPHRHRTIEEAEGQRRTNGEELDYFRPKRAMELLNQGAQMRGADSRKWGPHSSSVASVGASNAAAVHGLESLLASDSGLPGRRGRLESLPTNPPLPRLSHPGPGLQPTQETVDRRVGKRSKRHSLDPLIDPHKKHPPL